eukprot:scaffold5766_cov256-Pinguiococcus_pyrenoidosus.AAC.6
MGPVDFAAPLAFPRNCATDIGTLEARASLWASSYGRKALRREVGHLVRCFERTWAGRWSQERRELGWIPFILDARPRAPRQELRIDRPSEERGVPC